MKITIYGSTGKLGKECLRYCLDLGHEVTVLVRSPEKIPEYAAGEVKILQGDVLSSDDVKASLPDGTDAALFAVGMTKRTSPENLCTRATENMIRAMRQIGTSRLIYCGGGSNIRPEDIITPGARFVRWYAGRFMKRKHDDKENQIELLEQNRDLIWLGIRPLQMAEGKRTAQYRLGYNEFSAMSKISFADCAHAMVNMLSDDTWIGKMPIIQY